MVQGMQWGGRREGVGDPWDGSGGGGGGLRMGIGCPRGGNGDGRTRGWGGEGRWEWGSASRAPHTMCWPTVPWRSVPSWLAPGTTRMAYSASTERFVLQGWPSGSRLKGTIVQGLQPATHPHPRTVDSSTSSHYGTDSWGQRHHLEGQGGSIPPPPSFIPEVCAPHKP